MEWWHQAVPNAWQWAGLIGTLAGLIATSVSAIAAVVAAKKATNASEAAEAAKKATIELEQQFHVIDLVAEMQELQSIIIQKNEILVAAKADMIRGKIARFKKPWQAFQPVPIEGRENLDLVRAQLEKISNAAASSRLKPQSQWERIQIAFGEANQALQSVSGIQRVDAQEKARNDK